MPVRRAVPVPAHFWNSSQIFLTYPPGVPTICRGRWHSRSTRARRALLRDGGDRQFELGLCRAHEFARRPKIDVLADALAFNSFMGPNVPLYSLGDLDAGEHQAEYEQFFLRLWSYDTVGFRFDVDDVFKRLVAAVQANVPANMLGGDTPDQWVRDSHPCVKVRIMSGEKPNNYTPWGAVPSIDVRAR